jgi:hypothetical protein
MMSPSRPRPLPAGLAVRSWLSLLASAAVMAAAPAAELDAVRARGELVWAADQEGGGPHVFPDPGQPERLTGFEVEFADLLAGELGVRARFQQGQWDRLPLLLDTSADCVINGYELLPERPRSSWSGDGASRPTPSPISSGPDRRAPGGSACSADRRRRRCCGRDRSSPPR